MNYFKFFNKRALKNPLTLVVITFTLLVLMFTLAMNIRTYRSFLLDASVQQNLSSARRLKLISKKI